MSATSAASIHAHYAHVIKRLGRNARPGEHGILEAGEAGQAWTSLLAQEFTPPQEAAILMGLRVHGESPQMMAAFVEATRGQCAIVPAPAGGPATVVLYGMGTARKRPVLAPLLAMRLAQRGVRALLVTHDARRGNNASGVLRALGRSPCMDADAAAQALHAEAFAWLPIEILAAPLARVLARRAELGFRNSAHSLVKMLVPIGGRALVVANYTHAPYREAFGKTAELLRLSALLVRGTEGDPIAWEADAHPARAWIDGQAVEIPGDGVATRAADDAPEADANLPQPDDVDACARYTRAVIDGVASAPQAIERQVRMLAALSQRMV